MRTLKRTAVFLLTLLWLAGCGLCSFAAGDQPVLWAAQTEQSAVLYLPQSGDVTECLVGSVKCTGVQSKAISELEHPIHTLILLDNSLSIPKESRETISKILDNLVGNRMQGELYTIATISDDIRYLCSAESDYLSLGSAIDDITYENQNTQLTDRVYEAVQKLYDADPTQLCRVVIISDGVDDKQIGYTRTELENLLRSCGYPIYTVGCGPNDTAERKTKLENLFALSRVNRGQSWYLAETNDTFAIAKGICEYNGAQRVTAKLPDEVCDGSTRAIQVTCGGTGYSTQLKMPFVAASEPASSVSSAPASSAAEPVQDNSNQTRMLLLLAGAGAAVVIVLVVLLALNSCKDTLGAVIDQATGKADTVQEEDTTQWAEPTSDPLSLEGIGDPSAKYAAAAVNSCLNIVFNGIWSRQTDYFTAPNGVITITGYGTAEGTQKYKIALWRKVDGGAQYVDGSTYYIKTDGQNYRCSIGGLDPAASYRLTISYDSSRYYLYGGLKVEGIAG